MFFLTNFLFRNLTPLLGFLMRLWLLFHQSFFLTVSSGPHFLFSCPFTPTLSRWQQLTHTLLWDPQLWGLVQLGEGEKDWAKASSHPFHTGWKWKKEKKEEQAEERKWRRTCALCGCDLLDLVLMFFPYHSEGDASFTVCYGCHNTVPPTGYLKQEKFVISKLWKFLGPTTDFPTWGSSKGTENLQGIWLWRAQTKPCAHQEPGERSNVPTRDWARLACDCPRVSSGGVGQQWPAVGSGALNTKVQASILLKEVAITVITATIVWPQAENTATPINRKLD